jgi:hypothetical protein
MDVKKIHELIGLKARRQEGLARAKSTGWVLIIIVLIVLWVSAS